MMQIDSLMESVNLSIPSFHQVFARDLLEKSDKFSCDFDGFPDEVIEGAQQYCRDLISHGVFPLPSDISLFEFSQKSLVGDRPDMRTTIWSLVWRESDEKIRMMAFCDILSDGRASFIPLFCNVRLDSAHGVWGGYEVTDVDDATVGLFREKIEDKALVKNHFAQFYRQYGLGHSLLSRDDICFDVVAETWHMTIDHAFHNTLAAIGLMSTTGVVKSVKKAPKFTNKMRAKKKKHPIYEHKVLSIDPAHLVIPGAKSSPGLRASPRLHFRRGHVRRSKQGKVVCVRPCFVGDKSNGMIAKDYAMRPDGHHIMIDAPHTIRYQVDNH